MKSFSQFIFFNKNKKLTETLKVDKARVSQIAKFIRFFCLFVLTGHR